MVVAPFLLIRQPRLPLLSERDVTATISTIEIQIAAMFNPPLRERVDDIPLLIDYLSEALTVEKTNKRLKLQRICDDWVSWYHNPPCLQAV
jgi:transcriptional regulator with AAA-type ATPase domain